MDNRPEMFCYQCQETARGNGCNVLGVCGKHPETSAKMGLASLCSARLSAINRSVA